MSSTSHKKKKRPQNKRDASGEDIFQEDPEVPFLNAQAPFESDHQNNQGNNLAGKHLIV
jgi:hypothetical protein